MYLDFLDRDEYRDIPLHRIELDGVENNPVFITRYDSSRLPKEIHRHEYMQINYVAKGKMKHFVNRNGSDIVKGDIFIIPPYIPHSIVGTPGSQGEIIEFEFMTDFINQSFASIDDTRSFFDFAYIEPFLVSENKVTPRLNLSGKNQLRVENLLSEALEEFRGKQRGYGLIIKSILLKVLVLVGREFTTLIETTRHQEVYSHHRDAIFNTIQYIEENYRRRISIEEATEVSLLSQSYFSYLFKTITSKTFVEYLNDVRLSKAVEMLKDSDERVIDICYAVGFNSVTHFNKVFRKKTGVSPLTYRKSSRVEPRCRP